MVARCPAVPNWEEAAANIFQAGLDTGSCSAGSVRVTLGKEEGVARKVVSIAHLRELLAEREKELTRLEARQKKLGAELKQVEARITGLTGRAKAAGKARAAVKGRGQQARGKKSLKQAVAEGAGRDTQGPGAQADRRSSSWCGLCLREQEPQRDGGAGAGSGP